MQLARQGMRAFPYDVSVTPTKMTNSCITATNPLLHVAGVELRPPDWPKVYNARLQPKQHFQAC